MSYIRLYTTALLLAVGGCVDPSAPERIPTPLEHIPTQLMVSPDAIVLALGDSLLLQASAISLSGDSLPIGDTPVTWSSDDIRTVSVDARGMIKAHQVMSPDLLVQITARWTFNGATQQATATVNVTPTRQPIAGIRIVPKDSLRTSWSPGSLVVTWLTVVAVDANGDSVTTLRAPVRGHDTLPSSQIIPLYLGRAGVLTGGAPYGIQSKVIGDYWIYTHATVYGVFVQDSARFTGLYAYDAQIPIVTDSATNIVVSRFANQDVVVQPCGEVKFQNQSGTPADIVFDDPEKATGCTPSDQTGNIENLGAGQTGGRKFRAPGRVKWTFRNRETGQLIPHVSGTIVMREP